MHFFIQFYSCRLSPKRTQSLIFGWQVDRELELGFGQKWPRIRPKTILAVRRRARAHGRSGSSAGVTRPVSGGGCGDTAPRTRGGGGMRGRAATRASRQSGAGLSRACAQGRSRRRTALPIESGRPPYTGIPGRPAQRRAAAGPQLTEHGRHGPGGSAARVGLRALVPSAYHRRFERPACSRSRGGHVISPSPPG